MKKKRKLKLRYPKVPPKIDLSKDKEVYVPQCVTLARIAVENIWPDNKEYVIVIFNSVNVEELFDELKKTVLACDVKTILPLIDQTIVIFSSDVWDDCAEPDCYYTNFVGMELQNTKFSNSPVYVYCKDCNSAPYWTKTTALTPQPFFIRF